MKNPSAVILNIIWAICIYLAYFEGIEGFKSVVLGGTIVLLVLSILLNIVLSVKGAIADLGDDVLENITNETRSMVWFLYDLVLIGIITYFGDFFIAFMYASHTYFELLAKERIKKIRLDIK
jgi:hypothetical protein